MLIKFTKKKIINLQKGKFKLGFPLRPLRMSVHRIEEFARGSKGGGFARRDGSTDGNGDGSRGGLKGDSENRTFSCDSVLSIEICTRRVGAFHFCRS